MPDVSEYLAGYNLHQNMIISGYQLANVNVNHVQVKLWNEYSYPTTLVFKWNNVSSSHATNTDVTTFLQEFTNHIDGYRIIRSESGRPYKCIFAWPISTPGKYSVDDGQNTITLEYTGRAKRISEAEASIIASGGIGKEWN